MPEDKVRICKITAYMNDVQVRQFTTNTTNAASLVGVPASM